MLFSDLNVSLWSYKYVRIFTFFFFQVEQLEQEISKRNRNRKYLKEIGPARKAWT
jgi:hypothetical protein